MERKMRLITLVVFISLVVACDGPTAENEGESQSAEATEPAALETEEEERAEESEDQLAPGGGVEMSREQLVEQPRMELLKESVDPDFANPETTDWADSERDIPDSMTGSSQAVEELYALGAELRLNQALGQEFREQTYRILHPEEDQALGFIGLWGFMDDAMIGSDLLVHLEQEDGRWFVTELEERYHCLRGVDGGLCL
jgi:hypothetical protein